MYKKGCAERTADDKGSRDFPECVKKSVEAQS